MFGGIFQLLAEASGATPWIVFITVSFFVLFAAVVVVALACKGERADRAVLILRILLRSRVPRE